LLHNQRLWRELRRVRLSTALLLFCSVVASTIAQPSKFDSEWARRIQLVKTQEDFAAAMSALNKAIAASPNDQSLRGINMRLNSIVAYPRDFSSVLEAAAQGAKLGLRIDHKLWGEAFLELGDYARAREQLYLLEAASADKASYLTFLSKYVLGTHKESSYRADLLKLEQIAKKLESTPGTAPARTIAVAALLKLGADTEARRFLPKAEQDSKVSGYTMRQFANNVLVVQGRYSDAQDWLSSALTKNEKYAAWDMGRLLLKKGDYLAAEPLLQSAVKAVSDGSLMIKATYEFPLKADLVQALVHRKKVDEAKAIASSCPSVATDEIAGHWYISTVLWRRLQMSLALNQPDDIKRDTEAAYQALTKRRVSAACNDLDPEFLYDLLNGLMYSGYADVAKSLAADTLTQVPNTNLPWHLAVRGQAYKVLGNLDLATKSLAEAVALAPDDRRIRDALELVSTN